MAAVTASRPGEEARLNLGVGVRSLDQALGGGLAGGALHEIGPAAPRDGGAATGFAIALAVLALRAGGQAIWIRPDFAAAEAGELYGPGLALMGLPLQRLIFGAPRDVMGDEGASRRGRGGDRALGDDATSRRRALRWLAPAAVRPDPAPPALPGGECGDDALGGRVGRRRARRFRRPRASHLRRFARQESPRAHRAVALVMGPS
jgi:hypothetical protein